MRKVMRFTVLAIAVIVLLGIAGAAYQTWRETRDASRFPPPGTMVDIGGRRLHLMCIGEGEPVVIFEMSGFSNAMSFSVARAEVAAQTRVCSYDRLGTGWSDPAPDVVSAARLAEDLRVLVDRAGLPPPYILVPSSIGGLTVELFARRYPERVAGLVFLDAAHSDAFERWAPEIGGIERAGACFVPVLARIGVLRLLDPFALRQSTEPYAAAIMYRTERWETLCAFARGITMSAREFETVPPLPRDMPLVVLSHERPDNLLPPLLPPGLRSRISEFVAEWYPLQQQFAARSARGSWRVVPGSDHLIASSQPHAVASVILERVAEVRQGR